jgi:CheY-like chemotaxis protein
VFVNLLNNAAKYTPRGGHITLDATREDGFAVVRVRDTGQGIALDLLPRIFDLFMQADRSFDRSQGGLGIGLTLVQRLVRAHGGEVAATSAGPGQGSEFTVRLPLSQETPAAVTSPPPAAGAPIRRRVVVADDNADVAASYAELLQQRGHEVRAVSEGSRVVEEVEAFAPDVVFMDIGMPGLDGLEVAKRLRREFPPERLRIVAITGYSDARTRDLARAAGFDEHLVKPADPAAVERVLESLP